MPSLQNTEPAQEIIEVTRPQSFLATIDSNATEKDVLRTKQLDRAWNNEGMQDEKINRDLNLILVVVGLLSAVIAAFMIYVQPQLSQDPNDEATALLRVILYNMNSSAFGGEVPKVPQWTGPPSALYASMWLLYLALLTTIGGGTYAMSIRVASELNTVRVFRRFFAKFAPLAILWTILLLSGAFWLLLCAVTLQLPMVLGS